MRVAEIRSIILQEGSTNRSERWPRGGHGGVSQGKTSTFLVPSSRNMFQRSSPGSAALKSGLNGYNMTTLPSPSR